MIIWIYRESEKFSGLYYINKTTHIILMFYPTALTLNLNPITIPKNRFI